jgi:hypothetical protein
LKISVFNDDKKTDLIGETWINLEDVIIPGGGQNDLWHNLNFRGKYAGEIRIEITYYDTRPKLERPERVKQTNSNGSYEKEGHALSGPRQPKPVKRRPLPADPTPAAPPGAMTPEHLPTPPRAHSTPTHHTPAGYINTQSPLQAVEYGTPIRHPVPHQHPEMHHSYSAPSGMIEQFPQGQYEIYDPAPDDYIPGNILGRPAESIYDAPRGMYNAPYELPTSNNYSPPLSPTGPPPPPPKHASPAVLQSHDSYGFDSPGSFSSSVSGANRKPIPGHVHSPYQAYSPKGQELHGAYDEPSPLRYPIHDDYSTMQPSVEDAPPSPAQYGSRYDQVPSPAPLNLSGRTSAASGRNSVPTISSYGYTSGSPVSYRDSHGGSPVHARTSYTQLNTQRRQSEDPSYSMPSVPPTLVAGMDPMIAQEVSDRIYQEKRASFSQSVGGTPRGSYHTSYHKPHPLSHQETPPVSFTQSLSSYGRPVSRGVDNYVPRPVSRSSMAGRSHSPNPSFIARKSVSTSPAPSVSGEARRLSGVPFGPDDYEAFNPSVRADSISPGPQYSTPDGDRIIPRSSDDKIITYDGREVDPSDHLPPDTYAPEPEKKGSKAASEMPEQRRPPTTRRQLRMQGRPHSISTGPVYMTSDPIIDPTMTVGRNRLQKKSARASVAISSSGVHPSPLAPVSPYAENSFLPRPLPRATTVDFTSENYGGAYRGPPIPAKLPVPTGDAEGDAWALLEEMKSIDLGVGRGRRRGH